MRESRLSNGERTLENDAMFRHRTISYRWAAPKVVVQNAREELVNVST